jgi:hypothetical protein
MRTADVYPAGGAAAGSGQRVPDDENTAHSPFCRNDFLSGTDGGVCPGGQGQYRPVGSLVALANGAAKRPWIYPVESQPIPRR